MKARREILIRAHRVFGLTAAGFLLVAGLTGTLLAFRDEIDGWLNADLMVATATGPALPIDTLVKRVQAAEPGTKITAVDLRHTPGGTLALRVSPPTGLREPVVTRLYVDPVDGRITGRRSDNGCCNRQNIMQFVYGVHYTLQGGQFWRTVLGWIAFAWLLDCFVGFWLTFPHGKPFMQKWGAAWRLKRDAGSYRRALDLHRAGGLWLWATFATLAATGVYFNLRSEIFNPIVKSISVIQPTPFQQREAEPLSSPAVSFGLALEIASLAAERTERQARPISIDYYPNFAMYGVALGAPDESGLGASRVYVDGATGQVVDYRRAGSGSAGDKIVALQLPLHSGRIAGLTGRIVIALSGIAVAMLSITGVIIWRRKQRARQQRYTALRSPRGGQ